MRLIDADALIKKYGDWYVEEGTESGFIGTLKNLLATEPTIQPQSTDLIDRQAAIDAIHNSYDNILDFTSTGKTVADSIEDILSELPSAQPELIEKTAYIRGFEQGRTQGMIDSQGGRNE